MSSELGLGHLVAAGADLPGRSALSRERIIQTAIAFIDQRGLAALTMRRLGTEIGVEAMSLYRHVNGREDLLDAITDQVVAQLHPHSARPPHDLLADPTAGQRPPGGGWQTYLQRLAHAVRAVAREHPNVFPLIATRHPATPWLRPPLRSLRMVEDFLDTLIAHGFSDDQAVQAYQAFSGFLLGHLLLEVSLLGAQTAPAEEPLDEGDSDVPNADQQLDLDRFPHVQRLQPRLSEDHGAAEFEQALEDLLDRLDRLTAE